MVSDCRVARGVLLRSDRRAAGDARRAPIARNWRTRWVSHGCSVDEDTGSEEYSDDRVSD